MGKFSEQVWPVSPERHHRLKLKLPELGFPVVQEHRFDGFVVTAYESHG